MVSLPAKVNWVMYYNEPKIILWTSLVMSVCSIPGDDVFRVSRSNIIAQNITSCVVLYFLRDTALRILSIGISLGEVLYV